MFTCCNRCDQERTSPRRIGRSKEAFEENAAEKIPRLRHPQTSRHDATHAFAAPSQ
jgi:hypothetical protein